MRNNKNIGTTKTKQSRKQITDKENAMKAAFGIWSGYRVFKKLKNVRKEWDRNF